MENSNKIDVAPVKSGDQGKKQVDKKTNKKRKHKYQGRKEDTKRSQCVKTSDKYDNDVSWYAAHKSLVDDVASIPLRYPLGSNNGAGDVLYNAGSNANKISAWPGILSLEWIPSYGKSTSQSSALNIALRNIYQEIRQKNSGAKNYESADLGSYLILMDSIYAMIAEGKRAYGLCNYSDIYNWYLPQELLASAGFDYAQISHDKAVFRSRLNERIIKINNFAVPNEWNIMVRHYWLNSMVFADDEDASKAQLYVYKQMNHYTWTDYANAKLGFFNTYNKVNGIYPSISDYFSRLDALIDNVYLFDDASLMSGDILKAYESNNLIGITQLDDGYVTPIVHNKEVLQQIRNTMFLTFDSTDANNWLEINQSLGNGGLYCNPQLSIDVTDFSHLLTDWSRANTTLLLNKIYSEQPLYLDDDFANAEGVMIATRNLTLGSVIDPGSGNAFVFIPNETASEIFCAGRVYVRSENSSTTFNDTINRFYSPNVNGYLRYLYFRSVQLFDTTTYDPSCIYNLAIMSKFSYFPRMIQVVSSFDDNAGTLNYVQAHHFGEMRAQGYLSQSTLGNIHRVAILSLLGSKAFGSGTSNLDK